MPIITPVTWLPLLRDSDLPQFLNQWEYTLLGMKVETPEETKLHFLRSKSGEVESSAKNTPTTFVSMSVTPTNRTMDS